MINEEVQVMHFICARCERIMPVAKDNIRTLNAASGEEEIGYTRIDNSGEWITVFRHSKAGAPINVAACPHCNVPMYV